MLTFSFELVVWPWPLPWPLDPLRAAWSWDHGCCCGPPAWGHQAEQMTRYSCPGASFSRSAHGFPGSPVVQDAAPQERLLDSGFGALSVVGGLGLHSGWFTRRSLSRLLLFLFSALEECPLELETSSSPTTGDFAVISGGLQY